TTGPLRLLAAGGGRVAMTAGDQGVEVRATDGTPLYAGVLPGAMRAARLDGGVLVVLTRSGNQNSLWVVDTNIADGRPSGSLPLPRPRAGGVHADGGGARALRLGGFGVREALAAVATPEAVGRSFRVGVVVDAFEGRAVSAVVQPVLLLPAREARRPARDLLEHLPRHVVRHVRSDVGELGVEPLGGRSVGDAPRADPIGELLDRVDRACVDVAARRAADKTASFRLDHGAGRSRVRVVRELGELHAPTAG